MFRFTPDKSNRKKMESDWSYGYFLGVNPGTTEYLVGNHDDVYSCCTMRRLEENKAFDASVVKEIDMRFSDYVIQGARSSPKEVRFAEPGQPVPASGGDPVPRRAKLKPQDVERHGFTVGCPGCQQIQLKSPDRKNHTEECRRRMEGELTKTSDGQDRLDRAKDRLDTKAAEIGQAELDKQAKVDEEHLPEGQMFPEPVAENEDDVAELFGDFDDAPEVQRGPQRFDLSPRGSIPKRRVENDDMEDDSTDKRLRPRSPTISYRTDDASVGSNADMIEGDIGMLNEID
jgi:hypothetical protein